jgi:hypothetical protein
MVANKKQLPSMKSAHTTIIQCQNHGIETTKQVVCAFQLTKLGSMQMIKLLFIVKFPSLLFTLSLSLSSIYFVLVINTFEDLFVIR